jgi:hypothetical protein
VAIGTMDRGHSRQLGELSERRETEESSIKPDRAETAN